MERDRTEYRILTVAGKRYEDIVMYIARACTALGDRVLIQDLSPQRNLYRYLPRVPEIEPSEDILDCGGVLYTYKDTVEDGEVSEDGVSLLVRLHGVELMSDDYNDCLIYVTDEYRNSAEEFLNLVTPLKTLAPGPVQDVPAESGDAVAKDNIAAFPVREAGKGAERDMTEDGMEGIGCYLAVRDYTGMAEPYGPFVSAAHVGNVVEIPVNEADVRSRILGEYNGRFLFKNISAEMASLIRAVMKELHNDISDKEIKKAFKRAAGGKV